MRLLFVVDGQSPHSRNWIQRVSSRGHEVHLVTTYPCEYASLGVASCEVMEVDLSARVRASEKEAAMGTRSEPTKKSNLAKLRGGPIWKTFAALRNATAPFIAVIKARKLRGHIRKIQPEVVHAMRIPFEGIFASRACEGLPVKLILSTWGNDFSLFAANSAVIRWMTRRALNRADALHSDCHKDVRLALEHGLDPGKPTIVLPGNGGVRTDVFHPGAQDPSIAQRLGIAPDSLVVINPRGMKPYIRNEEFFAAIPLVLKSHPNAAFLCSSMERNANAEAAIARLGIAGSVKLLASVTHAEMADLFRLADVAVSASDHDGTPNTLLEAMACGALPVAGGIEPIREWIEDGENGILVDQTSPSSIAEGITRGLSDPALRKHSAERNWKIVMERAAVETVFEQAESFYALVAGSRKS